MSKIGTLIAELCPEGVDVKTLAEIGELVRGNGLPKTDFTESGVGAIHYGQIYTYYGTWATETIASVSPDTAAKLAKVDPGDVIITNTSENIEDVCKAVAWLGDSQIVTGGHATVFKHGQEPKYIAYWLQSPSFSLQKKRLATGTKVIDVSAKDLATVRIPVPPPQVQREIVRVLDSFSELEARRSQYSHYRAHLLTFPEGTKLLPLSEICRITRGRVLSKDYLRDHAGTYPVYSSQTANAGVFGFIDTFDYDFESITWTTDGANAGSVFFHRDEKFSITNVCGLLRVLDDESVNTKYLYYALGQVAKRHVSAGMGNPKLMANAMSKIEVPVPPMEEQERIVGILDKFDILVSDLSIGLPAELNARRKQYEYYRDRLLTFEELAV